MFASGDRANEPPVITEVLLPDGEQDRGYVFNLTAVDPDDDESELVWSDDTDMFDITEAGMIFFMPKNGDVGYNYFNATVEDPGGNTDTEVFSLFIANVNDPPELNYIPPQTASEGELFVLELSVYVEDPDLELPSEFRDRITYRDDTTKLDTNVETGQVTWTPDNDDVGEHFFMATITDTKGRSAQQEIKITVTNTNNPPVIGIIGKQNLVQGRDYSFIIPVSDPDFDAYGYDEELSFSNDYTDLFVIDAAMGRIYFTPENKHVGIWEVTVTVTDAADATSSRVITFDIENENDKPSIEYIPAQNAIVGELLELQIIATDPDMEARLVDGGPVDPNEALEYRCNSTRVTLDRYTGLLSFTPNMDDARRKVLVVRLTVVDTSSETSTVDIMFAVSVVNRPPSNLRIIGMEDGQVVRTDEKYPLSASAKDDNDGQVDLEFRWYIGEDLLSQVQNFQWIPEGEGPLPMTLEVTDSEGASSELMLLVTILNIPVLPEIMEPLPNDVIDNEEEVRFELDFPEDALDPEKNYTVTITSDVSGILFTGDAQEEMAFETERLPIGTHNLVVTLSDGTTEASTSFNITVERASMKTDSPSIGVVISLIALAVIGTSLVVYRKRY
jgi:hypothetical protein